MSSRRPAKPFIARAVRNIATILAVTAIFTFRTGEATVAPTAQDPYLIEQP